MGHALCDDGRRAWTCVLKAVSLATKRCLENTAITLKMSGQTVSTEAEILANPLYPTTRARIHGISPNHAWRWKLS